MIQILKQNGEAPYGLNEYIIDTKEELSGIPKNNTSMGSSVFVIEENKTYILNGNKNWIEKISDGTEGSITQETDPTVPNWAKQPLPPIDLNYKSNSINGQSGLAVNEAINFIMPSLKIEGNITSIFSHFGGFINEKLFNNDGIHWVQWYYSGDNENISNEIKITGELPIGHYLCAITKNTSEIKHLYFDEILTSFGVIKCWNLKTGDCYTIREFNRYIETENTYITLQYIIELNDKVDYLIFSNTNQLINHEFQKNKIYFIQFSGSFTEPRGLGIGYYGISESDPYLWFTEIESQKQWRINLTTQEIVEKDSLNTRIETLETTLNGLEALLTSI